jgi:ribosome-associated protein
LLMVFIADDIEIPDAELAFTTSRSSGPGGQNVNKVNTRVTLLFDLDKSPSLLEEQRALIHERLAGRINKEGILRVIVQRHRTQLANRDEAVRKFADLLRAALFEEEVRVPVKVPKGVNQRRLEDKRLRSRLKRERSAAFGEDD